MSEKPTAAATPDTENEAKPDPTLVSRRILCWVLSALAGGLSVAVGILLILKTSLTATVPISFVDVPLLPLAAIPATLFFMIWFDVLLKTRILND